MNAQNISNAATLGVNPEDIRTFVWNGDAYTGPDGMTIWIGWSAGGWGNGPYRFDIKVAAERPATEVISEARDRREADVTRSYRPLRLSDVHDGTDFVPNVWNAACAAATDHFHYLTVERVKKERRQIEDLLRKNRRFFEDVKAIYLRHTSAEDEY